MEDGKQAKIKLVKEIHTDVLKEIGFELAPHMSRDYITSKVFDKLPKKPIYNSKTICQIINGNFSPKEEIAAGKVKLVLSLYGKLMESHGTNAQFINRKYIYDAIESQLPLIPIYKKITVYLIIGGEYKLMNVQEVIKENKRRLKKLNSPYDPLIGIGSPTPRKKVSLKEIGVIHLPVEMIKKSKLLKLIMKSGSFEGVAEEMEMTIDEVIELYIHDRFIYDFEYWAICTVVIQDKLTLAEISFKCRKAQLILFEKLEEMRIAGIPIRIILLKARQWGGSTLVQVYMMWIQQIHRSNWHLAVCAQDDGAANNISEMYRRAAESYPEDIGTVTFKPYARSPKNSVNTERGGIIGVGSINNPNQFRSYNYPMCHISEAGIWEDTPKRTAKALVQSLRSTVPQVAYSLIVVESTAKGVGNFFHDEWLAASKGETGYAPVFVPWYKIDMYQREIKKGGYPKFISSMSEHDRFAWDNGATLEGINWYNWFQKHEKYEESQMFEEFPTTPEEAFISTGSRVFPYIYIAKAREDVLDPVWRGDIYPQGIANKKALNNIDFHVNATGGNLLIWKHPEPFIEYRGEKYSVSNRYCGFADIGGINPKADYSCLKIIDRLWMLWGGVPETAAVWHGHLDQDLFAWKCAQLGVAYNKMLLAIESNSLRTEKTDGDYFLTVLDNIADHYDNLFIRNNHESTNTDYSPKYGFHTGKGNKEMVITNLLGNFRGDVKGNTLYKERHAKSLDECDFFERKPDGKMGAVEGKKDDLVIISAGSSWLATEFMPPPKLIPYVEGKRKRPGSRKSITGEASFT